MKKNILFATLLSAVWIQAQNAGINTTSPKATLDVKGKPTDVTAPDGVIPPQLTRAQLIAKTAYGANQKGAMVYVTDLSGTTNAATSKVDKVGYYYFDGTAWQKAGGDDWSLTGNAGTNPAVNFIGTTDNNDVILKRNGNLGGLIGTSNTSFGNNSLAQITTGVSNVAVGQYSLHKNTIGNQNIAIGNQALPNNISGSRNLSMGSQSMNFHTDGNNNVALGYETLYNNYTGADNTAIGTSALYSARGNNNIGIGYQASIPDLEGSNQLSLGNSIYGLNINDGNSTNDLIGIAIKSPTVNVDILGITRLRSLPNKDGIFMFNTNSIVFNPNRTVVADSNGVLGAMPYTPELVWGGSGWRLLNGNTSANPVQYALDLSYIAPNYPGTWGAIGGGSMAFGGYPIATGIGSIAFNNNTSSGIRSMTWGGGNTTATAPGVSFGSNFATNNAATSFGISNQANGIVSTAFGIDNTASDFAETSIGMYGTLYTPISLDETNPVIDSDRIFNVGTGTNTSNRRDAFTILKNNKIGINASNFQNTLSDANLQVSGSLKIGNNATVLANNACDNNNRGKIIFVEDNFYGCKSTGWVLLNN